jgi:hypothetical protein
MIKKRIPYPKDLSADSIFSIIEMYFAGRYKTSKISDTRVSVRRLYKYHTANSREVAHKRMSFSDSGYFLIQKDSITFGISLGKQLLFWLTLLVFGVLITWKVWNASFLLSFFLITTPISVIWIIGILELKDFIDYEMMQIEKRLVDKAKRL